MAQAYEYIQCYKMNRDLKRIVERSRRVVSYNLFVAFPINKFDD